jgi:hypothetical protein
MYSVVLMLAMSSAPESPNCLFRHRFCQPAPAPAECPPEAIGSGQLKISKEVQDYIDKNPEAKAYLAGDASTEEKQKFIDEIQASLKGPDPADAKKLHDEAMKTVMVPKECQEYIDKTPEYKKFFETLTTKEAIEKELATLQKDLKK